MAKPQQNLILGALKRIIKINNMDINFLNELDQPEPLVGASLFQPGDPCPDCAHYNRQGCLVERESVYGKFVGCSNYPKCKFKH